jgi:hypothetical protein
MLRKFGIIAVVSLVVTALAAVPALATGTPTFNASAAPTGTHVQTGSPSCSFASDGLTVVCSSYELAGVGNTNATATLTTVYSATINCTNRGGELVEVHSDTVRTQSSTGALSPKNGRLTVPSLTSDTPTRAEILAQADCPNPNWTPSVQAGSIDLVSSVYTLHFAGFTGNYITIIDP